MVATTGQAQCPPDGRGGLIFRMVTTLRLINFYHLSKLN